MRAIQLKWKISSFDIKSRKEMRQKKGFRLNKFTFLPEKKKYN